MGEEGRFTTTAFDRVVLREAFPRLTEEVCSDVALATLFDVLSWQIRLELLSNQSIYRIEMPIYDADDNRYRILTRGGGCLSCFARVSFRYLNVNRRGYGDLPPDDRNRLPDRGVCPPQRMLMMSSIIVEGDEALVGSICDRFHCFLSQKMEQVNLLELLKQFARERLVDQPYPWLALDPGVAEFHSIGCSLL